MREQGGISFIMPQGFFKLRAADGFMAPGIGAGIYPYIEFSHIADGASNIPSRERKMNRIAHLIGGRPL